MIEKSPKICVTPEPVSVQTLLFYHSKSLKKYFYTQNMKSSNDRKGVQINLFLNIFLKNWSKLYFVMRNPWLGCIRNHDLYLGG